jgi:hypothetical protein
MSAQYGNLLFPFSEVILQSVIRQYLSVDINLKQFIDQLDLNLPLKGDLEVLGEKALAEGHIDLLVKEAIPVGFSKKMIIEVKTSSGTIGDVTQVKG